MSTPTLTLFEDRLLPREASALAAAREIYRSTKDLPIISPHGHVPVSWIADDMAFSDPTSLLITPDHYVNRLSSSRPPMILATTLTGTLG